MPIETAAELADFLDLAEFATAGSYAPAAGGDPAALAGIFDDPHILVMLDAPAPSSDSRPTFLCRSGDLPSAARGGDSGDTLTIGATAYRVVDLQPDGTGLTLIVLGL